MLTGCVFSSVSNNPAELVESWTNLSLSNLVYQESSEVVQAGAFGSDSYTKYILSFNSNNFEILMSQVRKQNIIQYSELTSLNRRELPEIFWAQKDSLFLYGRNTSDQQDTKSNCRRHLNIFVKTKQVEVYNRCI